MKKNIFVLISFCLMALGSLAQNNIKVKIQHKLGELPFNFDQTSENNLSDDFYLTRMQYYISEIAIIHDQGMETYVWDLYVLADAGEATVIDLGEHDINEVEGISFAIGVDQHNNHSDPAIYDPSHPLGPKVPSMHWGWTSGYRFVALGGKGGENLDQTVEIHGLGDANYFRQEVYYPATAENNEIIIRVDADYARALEDIPLTSGVINHGFISTALKVLENFRDYVFSPTTEILSTVDFSEVNNFTVFPNPAKDKVSNFEIEASKQANYEVVISDILGRPVRRFENVASNAIIDFKLDQAGLYFVSLKKQGELVRTEKLIVQ